MNDSHEFKRDAPPSEPVVEDLMIREGEDEDGRTTSERMSSVREIVSRLPESLSSVGRDISRTIERAIAAKDDYVVAVKVSEEAQDKLGKLIEAGVFHSRADAAAFLIDEGIKAQAELFARVETKLSEIQRLRAELRGMIGEKTP